MIMYKLNNDFVIQHVFKGLYENGFNALCIVDLLYLNAIDGDELVIV